MSQENVVIARRGYEHFIRTQDVLDEVFRPDYVLGHVEVSRLARTAHLPGCIRETALTHNGDDLRAARSRQTAILSGRCRRRTSSSSARASGVSPSSTSRACARTTRSSPQPADGIRTHDLLHGKQRRRIKRLTTRDDESRFTTRVTSPPRGRTASPCGAGIETFGPLLGHEMEARWPDPAPSCCRKAGQVERIGANTVRGNGRPERARARRHTTTRIPQSRSIGLLLPGRRGNTPPPRRCPRTQSITADAAARIVTTLPPSV
jgi:hypothetical protein